MTTQAYPPLSRMQGKRSNSTSSIWAQATVKKPNLGELISSVSTMLHCQMMRDINSRKRTDLPYFCEEHYTGRRVKNIPPVKSIYLFLKKVFEVGQFHGECCVISLVYINRLIGVTGLALTPSNWKPITITALVLAQKVWDDTPLINADFSILYPAVNVKEINYLERKFLALLEFKLSVSPALYAQYYYELRSISEENNLTFRPQPLLANRHATPRGHLSRVYQKNKYTYRKSSMTVEDMVPTRQRNVIS